MNEATKKALEEERESLKKQLAELEKSSTDYGDEIDGGDEESHETEAINLKLGMINTYKNRLQEIENELASNDNDSNSS